MDPLAICSNISNVVIAQNMKVLKKSGNKRYRPSQATVTGHIKEDQGTQNAELHSDRQCERGTETVFPLASNNVCKASEHYKMNTSVSKIDSCDIDTN